MRSAFDEAAMLIELFTVEQRYPTVREALSSSATYAGE